MAVRPSFGRPPNIVLLLGDDVGYNDVSFNGRREWQTPVLDRLGREGTVLRRFYTAAVVCAPSRAALLTGRHGIHNGVTGNSSLDLPASEVTLAQALKTSGYATGLFGKWHAGPPRPGHATATHPLDRGFDEFFGFTSAGAAWQKFPKRLFDGRTQKPVSGYADTLFTDRALDFIDRHKDAPFFLYVPYIASHGVVQAPPEDVDAQRGKFKERDPAKPFNATYAAEMVRLDHEIGRIVAKLDELKLTNDTIVIFTSDHGATFERLSQFAPVDLDSNFPFRGQKRTLWEGGLRVPGLVRWPGRVPAGGDSQTPLTTLDLFPTLLAAADTKPPTGLALDGQNVLDTLTTGTPLPERTLYWEWSESNATYYAAMRGDLKLVISGGNRPELYDVVQDPAERIDVSAAYSNKVKQLRAGLDAWLATTSDAAKLKKNQAATQSTGGPSTDDL